MAVKIVIRHSGNSSLAGRTQEFYGGIVRLGRRPGNDVQYDAQRDTKVSGFHVEVRNENGRLLLEDMRSKNGTYVNGNKMTRPAPIVPGDRITLGIDGPEFSAEMIGAAPSETVVASVGAGQASGPPQTIVGSVWSGQASGTPAASNGGYVASLEAPIAPAAPMAAPEIGLSPDWAATGRVAAPAPVDRAPSRISQGEAPRRSIGINTLMGELDKSRKSERKRIMLIALPALLVVAVVTAIIVRNNSGSTQTIINPPGSTQPAIAPESWAPVFKKIEPSVYQVQAFVKRNGQPVRLGSATAWSVKPGLLGTNGHVAALFDDLGPDGFVIARRVNSQNDLRLIKARTHPGYKQMSQLQLEYFPYLPEDGKFLELLQACDVALLEVHPDDIAKQGPPLPLAASDDVDVGLGIAYSGFPAEGVSVSYDTPVAYSGTGTINRTLGFLLEEAPPGTETFIQHSLNTVGGASGSPIFNIKGEVIALNFAGDKQGLAPDGTRLSVAGFKYAAPVRLLKELVAGEADAKQKERYATWEKLMKDRFARGVTRPKELMQTRMLRAREQIAGLSGIPPQAMKLRLVFETEVTLTGTADINKDIPVPARSNYVLTVCGDQPGQALKVDVLEDGTANPVNEIKISETEKRRQYYGIRLVRRKNPLAPNTVAVKYSSSVPTKVVVNLYQVVDPQAETPPAGGTGGE